jgi:hypothetical protein
MMMIMGRQGFDPLFDPPNALFPGRGVNVLFKIASLAIHPVLFKIASLAIHPVLFKIAPRHGGGGSRCVCVRLKSPFPPPK